ncbi:pectate lyase domain-containing protein [Ditylenchus destructor]|uniref:Probable pectate lyase F n=1 Tax=Ditylenchus destructor TaxID=166010 RepID=A0AAD4MJH1_9BILA|nr:pectate lyase domain-containing protein [Ditylenchus destructor]
MTHLPILVIIFHAGLVFGCGYSPWPTPMGDDVKVDNPQQVPKYYDGQMKRHVSAKGQIGIPSIKPSLKEGVPALFELADGAVIKNVVIGKKGADGIHCLGSCTIENCWWEYVGDDAATFLGKANDTYHVIGGGAQNALNKVFQHDGGGTAIIENFQEENATQFGMRHRARRQNNDDNARKNVNNKNGQSSPSGVIFPRHESKVPKHDDAEQKSSDETADARNVGYLKSQNVSFCMINM